MTEETAKETGPNKNGVDVHAKFVTWFTCGFILAFAPCVVGLILTLFKHVGECFYRGLSSIINLFFGCAGLAWWVTGIVWRFKKSGSYASGDFLTDEESKAEWNDDTSLYQLRSGKFMLIYYVINWAIIGAGVALAGISCLIACCGSRKSTDR